MADIEDVDDDFFVSLEDIVALVRSRLLEPLDQQAGRLATLDECVTEILAENLSWTELHCDLPGTMVREPFRLSILHALVRSDRFTTLLFQDYDCHEEYPTGIPFLLDRTLPFMHNVEEVKFDFAASMPVADAEAIFDRVRASRVSRLTMYCRIHAMGVSNALFDCLQAPSTIKELRLEIINVHVDGTMPEEAFQAFCDALPNFSLETLEFSDLVVRSDDVEHMLNTLSNAIAGSSVTKIDIRDEESTFTAEQLFRALSQSDSIHNHESLMVCRDDRGITIDRTCTVIYLSEFVPFVRERIQGGGNVEGEEECVASILARKTTWNNLVVDASNQNELRDWWKILQALAGGHRFEVLTLGRGIWALLPGNLVLALLDDILPIMTILSGISLDNVTMRDEEANAILRRINNSHVSILSIMWNQHDDNVMSALIDCLQGPSPITKLTLFSLDDDDGFVPEEEFQSFCTHLSDFPSLETLCLRDLLIRTTNVDHVTNAFSTAVVDSSLKKLEIMGELSTLSAEDIFQSLIRSDVARNLDLVLSKVVDEDNNGTTIRFHRSGWWKRVLTVEIPLNVWSIILEQANLYGTPPTILHYLFRENNAMLIPR